MDRFDEMRVKNISGGGGTVIIPPEAGNLIGIAITKMPKKLDYSEGDSININGLEVTAIYDNNVNGIVTSACTVTVNDPLTVYDTSVVVSYEGFETSFSIRVYGKEYEIPAGTKVLAHFDGNDINTINNTALSNSATCNALGKFGNACVSINAIDRRPHNIPTPSDFSIGTVTLEFWYYMKKGSTSDNPLIDYGYRSDKNGVFIWISTTTIGLKISSDSNTYKNVTATFSDALNKWHHYAFTFNKGTYSIFVDGKLLARDTYTSATGIWGVDYFRIYPSSFGYVDELLISSEVLYEANFIPPTSPYGAKKVLQILYIDTPPNKTIYQSGEYFDLTGAKIMAVFSTGETIDVTSKCIIENDTPITTSDTFRKISYTYEGVTKTVYVNVGAYTVESSVDLSSAKLLMSFDGSVTDATGLNTPVIVGKDLYGAGQFGMARYFNGSTDYISIKYNQDFDTGDFTIAFWEYTSDTKQQDFIGCYKNYASSGYVGGLRIGKTATNNYLYCVLNDTSGNSLNVIPSNGTYVLQLNQWNHIALVRSGDIFTCYVNGLKVNSLTYSGGLYNYDKFTIGARDRGSSSENITNFVSGYIDDFIISKSALWEGEFTPPTNPFSSIS